MMTNYSDMTDKEINEAVQSALGWSCCRGENGDNHPIWSDGSTFMVSCPNYCNDWAAIGPIIYDNGISIHKAKATANMWFATDHNEKNYAAVATAPTRAAAICFLMMKDRE